MTGLTPSDPGPEPALSEAERLLTAYLDDELEPADRRRFEAMLNEDPALAAEAASQRELLELTRGVSLMEPTDAEMRRFWAGFYNRNEWRLAWVLLVVGLLGVAGESIYLLLTSPALTWVMKAAALCTVSGGAILVWNTARLKMRTSRFDRYRGVIR